jgi:cytidylate kinase
MRNYVITIARGFGSGGKQISLALAQKLGIPCYEKQILTMASEYSGISESKFVLADEKLGGGKLLRVLKSKPYTKGEIEPSDKKFISNDNLFQIQAQIIRHLAENESCVIIGKAANWVLRDYDNVISVYIEAPRAACLASLTSRLGVSDKEAAEMIERTDKYRADYFKYYTGGRTWTDPVLYDMTLNSDRVGRDKCVKLIKDYLTIKFDDIN